MTTGTYVTPQGLDIPSVEDIQNDLGQDQRSTIDPLLNTDPDGPIGQLNGIFTSHLRRLYEIVLIAWNGNNPDAAEGDLLKNVCAITGTTQAAATPSKFKGTRKLRVTLGAAVTVPALTTHFHVLGDPSISFHTTEAVTSVGAGDYFVAAECDVTGPITCNATTLTVISTPVIGLSAVINDDDAELGTNEDTDPQLRIRREEELRATGSATVDSIRADLLAIKLDDGSSPIQEAVILENVTMTTDGNGLPPKSLECLIYDGIAQDCPDTTLAQRIWEEKPGGIELVGSSSAMAVDSQGDGQTIPFTRATTKEVLLKATLTLANVTQIPSQYLAVVRVAVIAEFAKKVKMGSVIRCTHYSGVIVEIPGIDDVSIQMAFNPPGSLGSPGENLTLDTREIGYIQTTGITVA